MSGFLQRLASRALGRAPAIRPIVGAYAPALRAEPMPHAEQPAEETALLLPREAAETGQRTATRQAPRGAADPAPAGVDREREDPPALPRSGKTRDASQAEPRADDTSRDRPRTTGIPVAPQVASVAGDRLAATGAHEAAASLQARLADSPDAVAPRSDASDSEPEPLRASGVAPPPAVRAPARPAFPPQRTRRQSSRMPQAGQHEPESITEVHVTIGRIELTAAPAVAPPRREPSKRKAQSLEEYLARREANRS